VAKVLAEIDEHLAGWIARQPMFFVATAPLAAGGHVNVSPKGPIGTFRVMGRDRVAYLDLTGSGAETIAHLRENGRIVVMFCAFDGPPQIIRLHGKGEAIFPEDPRFDELLAEARFEETVVPQAQRAVIVVHVLRIAKSCGYGVPLMDYSGERPHMPAFAAKALRNDGPHALEHYRSVRNAQSIDGLAAVEAGRD
jgi:hypothetical protein